MHHAESSCGILEPEVKSEAMSDERLARIEALLEHLTETTEVRHTQFEERWREIRRTVYGDGNGYKGMLVRIDRMEQADANRVWRERLLITAVIGLVLRTIHTLVL